MDFGPSSGFPDAIGTVLGAFPHIHTIRMPEFRSTTKPRKSFSGTVPRNGVPG